MAVERVSKRLKTWSEEKQKVVHLNEERNPVTLNLLGNSPRSSPSSSSSCGLQPIELESIEGGLLDLGPGQCLHPGLDKCLNSKTGAMYYLNSRESGVSSITFPRKKRLGLNSSEEEDETLDLKLNLSTSNSVKCSSNNSSYCSSDSSASEVESGMRLVGCVRCLMYYMVCSRDESCPKCKGSFLLNFLDGDLSSP